MCRMCVLPAITVESTIILDVTKWVSFKNNIFYLCEYNYTFFFFFPCPSIANITREYISLNLNYDSKEEKQRVENSKRFLSQSMILRMFRNLTKDRYKNWLLLPLYFQLPKTLMLGNLRRIWRRKNDHPTLSLLNPPNYQIFLVLNLVL